MPERSKYTMRDVARLAGVSTSTVSAVINKRVPVSPERMKRVLDAMAALDYHPDEVARSLKTGRTNVIGVVIPDITNAFYPEVIRGVEEAARRAGYGVLLCDSSEDAQRETAHLAMLSARRVDGVLLACCANSSANDTRIKRRFPMVFVDRIPPGTTESTVASDNMDAGYSAASHLIALGHERIAMLVGDLSLSPHHDRLEGFRNAMQEANLPVRNEYLIGGGVQTEDGRRGGHQLLNVTPAPTAIIVSNNKLLLGLLQSIEEQKVQVPEQISIVGFDDYAWNHYVNPRLTVVAQDTDGMGRQAFGLLLQLMGSNPNGMPIKQIRLKTELRVRNSTAPPAPVRLVKTGSRRVEA